MKILVACVGNELRGDDGLGPALAKILMRRELPEEVDVVDFGERLLDLLLMLRDYNVVIVIDALDMGGPPGSIYVLEPGGLGSEGWRKDPHGMGLRDVLLLADRLGYKPERIYIVGCQPKDTSYKVGLSEVVESRLSELARIVEKIIKKYVYY